MEDNEKLTHYLYGHEKEMLSLWKTLVETESGPKQPTGVESVRSLLAGELAAMGFTIRLQKVSGSLATTFSRQAPLPRSITVS